MLTWSIAHDKAAAGLIGARGEKCQHTAAATADWQAQSQVT